MKYTIIVVLIVVISTSELFGSNINVKLYRNYDEFKLENKELSKDSDKIEMKTAYYKNYNCYMTATENENEFQENGKFYHETRDICIYSNKDDFVYELCFFKAIKKYKYNIITKVDEEILATYNRSTINYQIYEKEGKEIRIEFSCPSFDVIHSNSESKLDFYQKLSFPDILSITPTTFDVSLLQACSDYNKLFQRMVQTFYSTCITKNEGWWSYELCINQHIKQYHKDNTQYLTMLFSNRSLEIYLGYYNYKILSNEEILYVDSSNKEFKYIQQSYTKGTHCDLTAASRSTLVLYKCNEESFKPEILSIIEISSCNYHVIVGLNLLCYHPLLKEYKIEEKQEIISCFMNED